MRRLLRWLVNGLCLLSLLACAGAAWVWWQGRAVGPAKFGGGGNVPWVEVAAAGVDLSFASGPDGLDLQAIRRWPGGTGAWGAWTGRGWDGPLPLLHPLLDRPLRHGHFRFDSGQFEVLLRPDRTPVRVTRGQWESERSHMVPYQRSGPMPYWTAEGIPHGLAVAALAVPPFLRLALYARLLHARRRRRRLGLCLRCGYDLTGNASGRCSECGKAVTAGRSVVTCGNCYARRCSSPILRPE